MKQERNEAFDLLKENITEALTERFPDDLGKISGIISELRQKIQRERLFSTGLRFDGRKPSEIRNITSQVVILPRTHGSALFTRGETQSLTVATLGSKLDEQMIENLEGESFKSFMLHYNFPPFSVGEVRPSRGPGRREIGHGNLAECALAAVIPNEDLFPYTIRVVSDILESNGSSSMATVCAGSLSLMDAGVPIKGPVAGIACGLIKEGSDYVVLSDIAGDEDHYGDMDFKIAGTKDGITAMQMDIKIDGVSQQIIEDVMRQSNEGRLYILGKRNETITTHRTELSPFAPRIETLYIPKEKIGELIGPGGKNIRALQEDTQTKIAIDDDGRVSISGSDPDGMKLCVKRVKALSAVPELNKVYLGEVKSIKPYGAFIEIIPGVDGLLHVSEMDHKRVNKVEDVLSVGQEIDVQIVGLDGGKIRLSRKPLLPKE
jgi:polyribonucleotide nucleotidyltransferase